MVITHRFRHKHPGPTPNLQPLKPSRATSAKQAMVTVPVAVPVANGITPESKKCPKLIS
jgi:hypothetical protein